MRTKNRKDMNGKKCGDCANIEPYPDLAFDTGKPFWGWCRFAGHANLFSEKQCDENFKQKSK